MTRFVDIMKCSKDEKMIFGIVGGLSHYSGVKPTTLRIILGILLLCFLLFYTQAFYISLLCYGISFFLTPNYEEMYDRKVNPDAVPPDFF